MKKLIFALITMATISLASCVGNATNQEATEETVETTIDSVCNEEPNGDTIVFVGGIELEQTTEATETETQE